MKKALFYVCGLAMLVLITTACEQEENALPTDVVAPEVLEQITRMGFSTDGIEIVEEGYRIERDIIITEEFLNRPHNHKEAKHGLEKQYSTNNLVSTNGNRVITIYAPEGRRGYSPAMLAGLDLAIQRFNDENLEISFQRSTNSRTADIVMTRLSKRDERRGVLGSAGFPTASGDPYDEIKMSGILESAYGLSTAGIATIIAHEMGHCIGFRHTDYFDRSISCGGGTSNEGAGSIGANHIPGTPTGATLSDASWMLSCADGSDRPFNNDDKVALDFLY